MFQLIIYHVLLVLKAISEHAALTVTASTRHLALTFASTLEHSGFARIAASHPSSLPLKYAHGNETYINHLATPDLTALLYPTATPWASSHSSHSDYSTGSQATLRDFFAYLVHPALEWITQHPNTFAFGLLLVILHFTQQLASHSHFLTSIARRIQFQLYYCITLFKYIISAPLTITRLGAIVLHHLRPSLENLATKVERYATHLSKEITTVRLSLNDVNARVSRLSVDLIRRTVNAPADLARDLSGLIKEYKNFNRYVLDWQAGVWSRVHASETNVDQLRREFAAFREKLEKENEDLRMEVALLRGMLDAGEEEERGRTRHRI